MIDIHCHILSGIDDGPSTIEESLAMAKVAIADGIHTIVATPHTLNGVYQNSLQNVTDKVIQLREKFSNEKIFLSLCMGSDAHLRMKMPERVESGEAVTINNGKRYLLVEFPPHLIPPWYKEELFHLKLKSITPIITHPERNLIFQQNFEIFYDVVAMGCLIQITAMSIMGEFGEEAMKCAHQLLKHRLAHVIATDAHDSRNRPPILSSAVETAGHIMNDSKAAESMVTNIPASILAGEIVNIPEPLKLQKKKWFFKFW